MHAAVCRGAIVHEADLVNTSALVAAGMEAGSARKIAVTKEVVMFNAWEMDAAIVLCNVSRFLFPWPLANAYYHWCFDSLYLCLLFVSLKFGTCLSGLRLKSLPFSISAGIPETGLYYLCFLHCFWDLNPSIGLRIWLLIILLAHRLIESWGLSLICGGFLAFASRKRQHLSYMALKFDQIDLSTPLKAYL